MLAMEHASDGIQILIRDLMDDVVDRLHCREYAGEEVGETAKPKKSSCYGRLEKRNKNLKH